MFVLLIGLVGVSALLPAGRFEILQGVKIDYATMIGRSAFRDLKTRGYLIPGDQAGITNWFAPGVPNVPLWTGNSSNPFTNPLLTPPATGSPVPSVAVVIDPLGCAAGYTNTFPFNPLGPSPTSMVRIFPRQVSSAILADPIFRCGNDLNLLANPSRDLPPRQQMVPLATLPALKRSSQGNYSWLATIVPDPNPLVLGTSTQMTVSVAVLYKRDLSTPGTGESATIATITGGGIGGGEVTLTTPARPVKPGQWIMLAGVMAVPVPPPPALVYRRWYRVVAADNLDLSNNQAVTLAGPDWPVLAPNPTTAWIIDNVIAVYEKNMRLEMP